MKRRHAEEAKIHRRNRPKLLLSLSHTELRRMATREAAGNHEVLMELDAAAVERDAENDEDGEATDHMYV